MINYNILENNGYIKKIEDRYLKILSNGGKVQRSFYQNVGKIINKNTFENKNNSFDDLMKNVGDIIYGK